MALVVSDMSMSLAGFVTGPNDSRRTRSATEQTSCTTGYPTLRPTPATSPVVSTATAHFRHDHRSRPAVGATPYVTTSGMSARSHWSLMQSRALENFRN